MLAIIGGNPARFAPFSQLFRDALDQLGQAPRPVGVHSPGHVAATDEQAREEFWPHYRELFGQVASERGFAVPTEASFRRETGPDGALYVGSPETVARKIAANLATLGASRFDLKYGMGRLPHEASMTRHRAVRHPGHPAGPRAGRRRGLTVRHGADRVVRFSRRLVSIPLRPSGRDADPGGTQR